MGWILPKKWWLAFFYYLDYHFRAFIIYQRLLKDPISTDNAHVKEQIAILSPGGGYVFQQVHNILADVPPKNIVAMFDAARS